MNRIRKIRVTTEGGESVFSFVSFAAYVVCQPSEIKTDRRELQAFRWESKGGKQQAY